MRVAAVLVAIALSCPQANAGPHEPPVEEGGGAVEPTTADEWLRLGLARFEEGDYGGAIEAFDEGHALDPRPQFLFAAAQAERLRGNCKGALVYYERFLDTDPPDEQASAARQQQRRCSQVVTSAATVPAAPPPPPPPPPPLPEPDDAGPSPWTDPVTLAVGGGAVALTLTGAGFLFAADAAAGEARDADSYDRYLDLRDRAGSRQLTGIVTLSAGAVLGGYTIYRLVRGGGRAERRERAVQVAPGPGVGLALGGRF